MFVDASCLVTGVGQAPASQPRKSAGAPEAYASDRVLELCGRLTRLQEHLQTTQPSECSQRTLESLADAAAAAEAALRTQDAQAQPHHFAELVSSAAGYTKHLLRWLQDLPAAHTSDGALYQPLARLATSILQMAQVTLLSIKLVNTVDAESHKGVSDEWRALVESLHRVACRVLSAAWQGPLRQGSDGTTRQPPSALHRGFVTLGTAMHDGLLNLGTAVLQAQDDARLPPALRNLGTISRAFNSLVSLLCKDLEPEAVELFVTADQGVRLQRTLVTTAARLGQEIHEYGAATTEEAAAKAIKVITFWLSQACRLALAFQSTAVCPQCWSTLVDTALLSHHVRTLQPADSIDKIVRKISNVILALIGQAAGSHNAPEYTEACLSEVTGPSETPHTSQRGQAVSMEARVSLVSGLLQGTVEMYQQSVGPEGCAALTRHMLPWLVRATLRAYKTQVHQDRTAAYQHLLSLRQCWLGHILAINAAAARTMPVDTITDSSLDKWHACAHQLLCQTLHTACCCHATAAHVATSVLCAVTQHEDAATQAQIVHTVLGLMRDAAAWVAMCAASGGDASEAERHALRLQVLLASITQVLPDPSLHHALVQSVQPSLTAGTLSDACGACWLSTVLGALPTRGLTVLLRQTGVLSELSSVLKTQLEQVVEHLSDQAMLSTMPDLTTYLHSHAQGLLDCAHVLVEATSAPICPANDANALHTNASVMLRAVFTASLNLTPRTQRSALRLALSLASTQRPIGPPSTPLVPPDLLRSATTQPTTAAHAIALSAHLVNPSDGATLVAFRGMQDSLLGNPSVPAALQHEVLVAVASVMARSQTWPRHLRRVRDLLSAAVQPGGPLAAAFLCHTQGGVQPEVAEQCAAAATHRVAAASVPSPRGARPNDAFTLPPPLAQSPGAQAGVRGAVQRLQRAQQELERWCAHAAQHGGAAGASDAALQGAVAAVAVMCPQWAGLAQRVCEEVAGWRRAGNQLQCCLRELAAGAAQTGQQEGDASGAAQALRDVLTAAMSASKATAQGVLALEGNLP